MSETQLLQVSQPHSKVPTPEQLPHIAINISEYKDFAKKQALFVDKTLFSYLDLGVLARACLSQCSKNCMKMVPRTLRA